MKNINKRITRLEQALPEASLDDYVPAFLSDGRVFYEGVMYTGDEWANRPYIPPSIDSASIFELPRMLTPEAEKRLLKRLQS